MPNIHVYISRVLVVFTSVVNAGMKECLVNVVKTSRKVFLRKQGLFLLFPFRATTVRFKGRNLRIKAPMCRALKKLCDPDGELQHTAPLPDTSRVFRVNKHWCIQYDLR